MVDGSYVLIEELSNKKNQNKIKKVVFKIIKKSGVLKDSSTFEKSIEFIPYASNTDKCTLFFKIKPELTITGEEITILIRPDNDTEHRVLRVLIQEGSKVLQKKEDYDKHHFFKKSDDAIFWKEISAIELDIKRLLDEYTQRNK